LIKEGTETDITLLKDQCGCNDNSSEIYSEVFLINHPSGRLRSWLRSIVFCSLILVRCWDSNSMWASMVSERCLSSRARNY